MTKETRSVFAVVAAILVVIVVALPLTFYLMNRPRIAQAILPTPNAYDTVAKASAATSRIPMDYAETNDAEVLEAFVQQNQMALELAESAIDQECVVPVDYYAGADAAIESADVNRPVSRLLIARGRLAEMKQDYFAAAEDYAKVTLINSKLTNGGLLVHLGGALACEKQGLEYLLQVAPKLSPKDRQKIKAFLRPANRKRIAIDEVLLRESNLSKIEYGTIRGTILSRSRSAESTFVKQVSNSDERNQRLFSELTAALDERLESQ